jgi:hypothetical protein
VKFIAGCACGLAFGAAVMWAYAILVIEDEEADVLLLPVRPYRPLSQWSWS